MIDTTFIDDTIGDYWWDVGFEDSQKRVASLDSADWTELCTIWSSQSVEWQDRLAYILGEGDLAREVPLLLSIASVAPDQVSLRARETLRDISFDAVRPALPDHLRSCSSINEVLASLPRR